MMHFYRVTENLSFTGSNQILAKGQKITLTKFHQNESCSLSPFTSWPGKKGLGEYEQ
jgi:hypothetical protein